MKDYLNRNLESEISSNYVENDIMEFFVEGDHHHYTCLAKNPKEMSDTYTDITKFLNEEGSKIIEYCSENNAPPGLEAVMIESVEDFKRIYHRDSHDMDY
jgi:hypothetical protein